MTGGTNEATLDTSQTDSVTVTAYNALGEGAAPPTIPVDSGSTLTATPTSSFTGWSTVAPTNPPALDPENGDEGGSLYASQASDADLAAGINPDKDWGGGSGCAGLFTGKSPKEMVCRDSAYTVNGTRVAIRWGTWNGEIGFGWSKAYYYHNLIMQAIIDTITLAAEPRGSLSNRSYEVYWYYNGEVDEDVIVVADVENPSWRNVLTPDGEPLGVVTGYCQGKNGSFQAECPEWVDETL